MTRDEAMAWLRERFSPEVLQRDPAWVETMVEILMVRVRGCCETPRQTSAPRRGLESVGGRP